MEADSLARDGLDVVGCWLGIFENGRQNPPWEAFLAWLLGESFSNMASC